MSRNTAARWVTARQGFRNWSRLSRATENQQGGLIVLGAWVLLSSFGTAFVLYVVCMLFRRNNSVSIQLASVDSVVEARREPKTLNPETLNPNTPRPQYPKDPKTFMPSPHMQSPQTPSALISLTGIVALNQGSP